MSLYHTSNRDRLRTFWPVLLLVVLSFAVYLNALWGGFVYDDGGQILRNAWIRDLGHIPEIFTSNAWGFYGARSINYYRPVMHLVYMADYYLFGLNPWCYHLTNILLHAGVTVLVYLLSVRLIAGPGTSASPSTALAPFMAAALFSVHPVHTEAVTWIAGLPEVSFSLFYLAAFQMYVRSLDAGGKGFKSSVALFFVSCFCKETALTVPLLIICYEHLYRRSGEKPAAYIRRYTPYFLAALAYMAIRFHALGGFAPHDRHPELSGYEHVINVLPLFAKYLLKLLLPFNLNAFHVLHPIHSLLQARGLLSIAAAACFVSAGLVASRKNRVAIVGMAVIVVPLLPVFYISGLGENTFAERYLYLPSAGFAILMGISLGRLAQTPARLKAALIFGTVLFAFSAGTVSRNAVWKDDYSLWTDTVARSPEAVLPRMNLGLEYLSRGKPDEALKQVRTSLKLAPDNALVHCNMGVIYYDLGSVDKAIDEFGRAIHLDPDMPDAHYYLGRAYYKKGLTDMAVEEYKAALRADPYYLDAHSGLGEAYLDEGRPDKAVEEQMAAVRIDPASSKAHYRLGLAYKAEGDLDTAVTEYLTAIRLGPSAEIYNNLGNVYAARGELDSAIAQYRKSLELNPGYGLARHNIRLARKIKGSDTLPRGIKNNDPDTPRRAD